MANVAIFLKRHTHVIEIELLIIGWVDIKIPVLDLTVVDPQRAVILITKRSRHDIPEDGAFTSLVF